jgi:RNA polymerase sigma-70 factor, ECF subfamily
VTSDQDLMLACQQGSAQAFEELFERYRQPIWAYFRRRIDDFARAEELAQEVFVAVLQGAARWEPRALFRTYLYGIAFNLLMAERRKARGRSTEPLDEGTSMASGPDPSTTLWVRRALQQLEDSDREIVMLREYEQLSYAEIAALLDLPLNTVRSRLFRARLELRRLLAPETASQGTVQ